MEFQAKNTKNCAQANCSGDRELFLKFEAKDQEFTSDH